jgi:hypothetical protein
VEITGLQKMLKLVSLCLNVQADMPLHVHECCNQHDRGDSRKCRNGVNWAGRWWVSVAKYKVLLNFILISKLMSGLHLLI